MSDKHASAPWKILQLETSPQTIVLSSDNLPVALVFLRSINSEAEEEANARLIAAAPELYAAVKEFCDYYDGNKASMLGNGMARKCLDAFRAVLAKVGQPERTNSR